jgi:antirestriction protein ArdC
MSKTSARKAFTAQSTNTDYADTVSAYFIKSIQEGTAPWMNPWKADQYLFPHNPDTGHVYQGFNSLWLELVRQARFQSNDPRWMTFLQIKDNGYHLQKGSKSTPIQYFNKVSVDAQGKIVKDEKDAVSLKTVIKYYMLFHASQIDGLPPFLPPEINKQKDVAIIDRAQAVLDASKAVIIHDQNDSNFYLPKKDEIHLTPKHTFDTLDSYYAAVFHELSHWTGHEQRLNRPIQNKFGSEAYALEELRAEISAFMICKSLSLDFNPKNSVNYVASWTKALQNNTHEIIKASRDADKIKDYCFSFKTQTQKHERPAPVRGIHA